MSEDSTSAGLADQNDVITRIATALHGRLPQGASQIRYEVRSLTPFDQAVIRSCTNGTWESMRGLGLQDLSHELRAVMYRPGAGTWYTAAITVTADGSVDADFNYDDEPAWTRPVEPIWYAQDLEKFPRDEGARPAWLRQRLSEARKA